MEDKNLELLVQEYADLAKDKRVDATTLMISALQQQDENRISAKAKRWAYILSITIPPLGLVFIIWFYFSEKSDGKQTAVVCLVLAMISGFFTIVLLKGMLTSSGLSPEQLQQIKPQDIYQLSQ